VPSRPFISCAWIFIFLFHNQKIAGAIRLLAGSWVCNKDTYLNITGLLVLSIAMEVNMGKLVRGVVAISVATLLLLLCPGCKGSENMPIQQSTKSSEGLGENSGHPFHLSSNSEVNKVR
jgi:hypothetical protein